MHRREWFKVGALAGAAAGVSWLAHTPLAQEATASKKPTGGKAGADTSGLRLDARREFFGVRTAWHGPGDVSPVGHACNVHLDLATPNFGIQEGREFTQAEQDVFPGCPELKNGYFHATDKPGFGIDLDEKLAAKFPIQDDPPFDLRWGNVRRKVGTVVKP